VNAIITQIRSFLSGLAKVGVKGAFTYAVHLLFVFLAAVALHFGWHISVPVLPTALTTMTGFGALRWIVHELAKQYHFGRLEAQAEKDAENYLENVFGPIIKHIADLGGEEPKNATSPKAVEHNGAYL